MGQEAAGEGLGAELGTKENRGGTLRLGKPTGSGAPQAKQVAMNERAQAEQGQFSSRGRRPPTCPTRSLGRPGPKAPSPDVDRSAARLAGPG